MVSCYSRGQIDPAGIADRINNGNCKYPIIAFNGSVYEHSCISTLITENTVVYHRESFQVLSDPEQDLKESLFSLCLQIVFFGIMKNQRILFAAGIKSKLSERKKNRGLG